MPLGLSDDGQKVRVGTTISKYTPLEPTVFMYTAAQMYLIGREIRCQDCINPNAYPPNSKFDYPGTTQPRKCHVHCDVGRKCPLV